MAESLLPTTVVGSYPQPDWLIDRDRLTHLPPVRVRAHELWRVQEPWLEQAQDDATVPGRSGGSITVPRIVGPIRRLHAVEVRDVEFLRRNTDRMIKITLPGPFTMSRQAQNEYYKEEEELVMDYAAAVNAEVRDLKAAGADVIQLDEPWVQARPEEARRLALPAIDRALEGIPGPTALHLCFGYAYVARNKPSGYSFLPELTATVAQQISIEAAQPNLDLSTLDRLGDKTVIFGVISMGDHESESPETVAGRIRRALEYVPPQRLIPAPDCGMKYIPRDVAFAKLQALAEGAAIVRRE